MSYSAYSHVIFGIKTNIDSVKQNSMQRTCDHDVQSNMNFCPECGKPTFTEKTVSLLDSMEENGLSYFYSDPSNKDDIIIGFQLGVTDYNKDIAEVKPATTNMTEEIMQFCKDNNLSYTENHCKMYVITYHSY